MGRIVNPLSATSVLSRSLYLKNSYCIRICETLFHNTCFISFLVNSTMCFHTPPAPYFYFRKRRGSARLILLARRHHLMELNCFLFYETKKWVSHFFIFSKRPVALFLSCLPKSKIRNKIYYTSCLFRFYLPFLNSCINV